MRLCISMVKYMHLWSALMILSFPGISHCNASVADANRNGSENVDLSHEARLRRTLLSRHVGVGPFLRPVKNSSHAITIEYGMRLIKMSVDEASQSIITNVWTRMKWYDEIMMWNKHDYGGLSHLTFDPNSIWTPHDVTVANTVETEKEERTVDVHIRNDGMAFWTPHRQYKSECLLDLTDYPYDSHTCSIWIQSLAGYGEQVDLQLYSAKKRNSRSTSWELDTYMKSHAETQQWKITYNGSERVTSSRHHDVVLMYSNKVALRFTLTIERRPSFVAYLVMFPGLVLSFLATLTFCLPPERPDRNMLAMSLFMSFMVLLLILLENVPPSAIAVPKLVWLYCFNLGLSVVCIFCSVIVINISRFGSVGSKSPPLCLQKFFFGFLAKLLCMTGRVLAMYDACSMPVETYKTKPICDDDEAKLNATLQWKMIASILDRSLFLFFVTANCIAAAIFFPVSKTY